MGTPARRGGAVRAVLVGLRRAAVGVRWYCTTLMGDHDYARYVEHLARVHPEQEPETVQQYWRSRHDSPVQARCC